MKKISIKTILIDMIPSILAVIAALLLGAIIILLIGENPIDAYIAMFRGAFGSAFAIADTLQRATPYVFGALAFLIAAKGGLFNIGIEGQMYIGAIVAAIVGFSIPNLPPFLHITITLLFSMVGGMLFSLIPGILKVKRGVHEVISTVMLNYVAFALTGYLTVHVFHEKGAVAQTYKIFNSAELKLLYPPSKLNLGFIIAIVLAVLIWVFLYKTPHGYDLRVTGFSEKAASYAGIKSKRVIFYALLGSGAVSGLLGAERVLGVYGRFIHSFSPGYGFTAIAVSLLGKNHPLGIIPAAILFGALENGGAAMSLMVNVPRELGLILQALIIVLIASAQFINKRLNKVKEKGVVR